MTLCRTATWVGEWGAAVPPDSTHRQSHIPQPLTHQSPGPAKDREATGSGHKDVIPREKRGALQPPGDTKITYA